MKFRRGLSLLEVMLALAIMAGAIATASELLRMAARNAVRSSNLTSAQLACESVVAYIMSGAVEPTPVERVPYDMDQQWLYSIQLSASEIESMVTMTVVVEQAESPDRQSARFSIVRLIPDPGIEFEERAETQSPSSASSSSGAVDDDATP